MRLVSLLLTLISLQSVAQSVPTVRTREDRLRLYMNGSREGFSGIGQLPKSFSYSFETGKAGIPMAIVSEKDSIAFVVTQTKPVAFQIVREQKQDTVQCLFTGISKKAVFNQAYIDTHTGKSFVEVPEVYELVNVLYTLTPQSQTDQDIVNKDTKYYQEVLAYFNPYRQHRAISVMDSLLKAGSYAPIKMDSYAVEFAGDQLRKGDVFDRVSWGEVNTLDPYLPLLADFARQAKFRSFYQAHKPYYERLKQDFRQNIALAEMKQWLDRQFPKTSYACVKVVASPLVGANQSANWFEDNGFRETQAHIDLPDDLSPSESALARARRQEIAFTELNHAYENPEAESYGKEVNQYFGDLSKWTAGKASASYQNSFLCFQEYMNWALVTLYHADHVSETDFNTLCQGVEQRMVDRRGFSKFRAFNQELLRLYRARKPAQTVADLYPALFAWAASQ
ncbi:DUF4932 domain-containing protein [Spirosoma koreense]